jgi:hypothetical protein
MSIPLGSIQLFLDSQNYKVSYTFMLMLLIATHLVAVVAGFVMVVGAIKKKKVLLIPW